MKRRDKRIFRVLVSVWIARTGGRDTLTGIFRYLAGHPSWQLSLVQSNEEFTPDLVQTAKDKGFDGIIATIPGSQETLDALVRTPLPLVIKNIRSSAFKKRSSPTVFIYNDNAAIGRLAATTLLSNGRYASFAYVPELDENWCHERGESFRTQIVANGFECAMFRSETHPQSPSDDHEGIMAFIASLPKPVAVYAATDQCAVKILAAANEAKVSVPAQMALLGTDNDEFLTQYASPPISSILPGHVAMGFRAASELDRLMRGDKVRARHPTIYTPPVSVIERASTTPALPATTLVARIKAYIAEHGCQSINVMDVVGHLGVSRSLAEIRFRQIEGKSIRQAIEERRLSEAARLLRQTALTVQEIARRCGFSGQNRLSHVFKTRFGLAPEHWRLARSPQVP